MVYSRRQFLTRLGGSAFAIAAGRGIAWAGSRDTSHHIIPYHRQEHLLSCEIASLRMAAAFYGQEASEEELLGMLPFEKMPPRTRRNGKLIWGDPRKGFVGNLDGWQIYYGGLWEHPPSRRNVHWWGYGVYIEPIAEVATKIGLAAQCLDELDSVYWHLDHGHPVIAIVPAGGKTETVVWTWHTKHGEQVPVMNREHAVVLNPGYDSDRIWVNDPDRDLDERILAYTHRDFARAFGILSMAVAISGPRVSVPSPGHTYID